VHNVEKMESEGKVLRRRVAQLEAELKSAREDIHRLQERLN